MKNKTDCRGSPFLLAVRVGFYASRLIPYALCFAQAACRVSYALAVALGGVEVALQHFIYACICWRLGESAYGAAQVVEVGAVGSLAVGGWQAQADPDAAVLAS